MWSIFVVDILRPLVKAGFQRLYNMEFFGLEHVPPTGPLIVTPNHVSYYDPILVHLAVRRRFYYMAWDKIFEIPVFNSVIRQFGAFPVKLEGHDLSALRRANEVLKAGQLLVIFPEGGRSLTGALDPFRAGAFHLAIRLNVPVLPVAMVGAWEVWPPQRPLPKLRGKIDIYYHAPIYPETLPDLELKERVRHFSDQAYGVVDETLRRVNARAQGIL